MATQDVLHLVFQAELALLQLDFFELFGFRQVRAGGEFVETIVQLVVLQSQLAKLLVGLQQELAKLVRVNRHAPPPWGWPFCRRAALPSRRRAIHRA
jgi:hypothetical protein